MIDIGQVAAGLVTGWLIAHILMRILWEQWQWPFGRLNRRRR